MRLRSRQRNCGRTPGSASDLDNYNDFDYINFDYINSYYYQA
jgi:hypothetical protein